MFRCRFAADVAAAALLLMRLPLFFVRAYLFRNVLAVAAVAPHRRMYIMCFMFTLMMMMLMTKAGAYRVCMWWVFVCIPRACPHVWFLNVCLCVCFCLCVCVFQCAELAHIQADANTMP